MNGDKPGPEREFNPRAHLTNLRGKEYLEVKWRLAWLRAEHDDYTLETKLISVPGEPYAIVSARVQAGGRVGTGLGARTLADAQNTNGRFVEMAETAAIGRALAAIGYGTQFTDDFDEPPGEVTDAPVEHRPAPAPNGVRPTAGTAPARPPVGPGPVTGAQKALLARLASERGVSPHELSARLLDHYETTSIDQLTKAQASETIDWLQHQIA